MPAKARRWSALCASIFFGLAVGATCVHAQSPLDDPDWKESEAPAPPAFNPEKLLPLDMPLYVSLKFGVDPASISITSDGIVRYVVVARNDKQTVSAFYEGILCAKGEVKRYAQTLSNGQWRVAASPQWRALNDNQPSRHAWVFARQGACDANTAASSVADIVRALKK